MGKKQEEREEVVTVTNDSEQTQYWGNSSGSALTELHAKEIPSQGHLGGSGHDLTVGEFEPRRAASTEPSSDPLSPSLSAPPLLALSQK